MAVQFTLLEASQFWCLNSICFLSLYLANYYQINGLITPSEEITYILFIEVSCGRITTRERLVLKRNTDIE